MKIALLSVHPLLTGNVCFNTSVTPDVQCEDAKGQLAMKRPERQVALAREIILILIALHARVIDWQSLQRTWRESRSVCRSKLVTRMGLYRNGHNASKVLMLIELPDIEAREDLDAWKQMLLPCLVPDSMEEYIWDIIEHEIR